MQSEDHESAHCPYCGQDSECEHLLLCVDTTYRESLGGQLYETFLHHWAATLSENADDPSFHERDAFDALLETIDGLADYSCDYVIEGGAGMTSAYSNFYVSTVVRMKASVEAFGVAIK